MFLLSGLLPILLSATALIMRNRLLDYAEKLNKRNKTPTGREILSKRLMVSTAFLFIIGIYGLLKSL